MSGAVATAPQTGAGAGVVGGFVKIVSHLSGLAAAVQDASAHPGKWVVQWPYEGDASQQWVAVRLPDAPGLWKIVSLLDGLVMAVQDDSTDPGAHVVQWPYEGKPSQQWRIEPVGNAGYRIVSVSSGLALAVQDNTKEAGKGLVQWPFGNGDPSRVWDLVSLD